MSAARSALLLIPALGLAACAARPSGEAVGRFPAPSGAAEAGPALATLPPAAGRVVSVRRTPFANGFRQEVVLEGPRAMAGENRIVVEALTTSRTGARGLEGEELRLGPPSDAEVAAAMDRDMPGVPMRVAEAPLRGASGTIGYAFGSAGRLSCVYAWQYLAPARPLSLFEGVTDTGALPMSVRVRLCREQPVAGLVESLRGLRVAWAGETMAGPSLDGDPLAAALGPAADLLPASAPKARDAASPRPARVHRRSTIAGRRGRRRSASFPRAASRYAPAEERDAAPSPMPRLPLPAEVASEADAASRPAPPPRAGSASGVDMPLPR